MAPAPVARVVVVAASLATVRAAGGAGGGRGKGGGGGGASSGCGGDQCRHHPACAVRSPRSNGSYDSMSYPANKGEKPRHQSNRPYENTKNKG